jgi:cytochrome P450
MNNMVHPILDRLKIGPIVRLAPNMVSVSGIDSIKLLYGTSALDRDKMMKGTFGGEFAEGNIGSLPPQEAIKVRRLISPPFGRKFLQDQQHVFKECVNKALNKITRMSQDGEGVVDFYYIAKLYAFEVISSSSI